jgi:hypothetical protein
MPRPRDEGFVKRKRQRVKLQEPKMKPIEAVTLPFDAQEAIRSIVLVIRGRHGKKRAKA